MLFASGVDAAVFFAWYKNLYSNEKKEDERRMMVDDVDGSVKSKAG